MDSDVCVVGGGPAGMMLAVLLLRQGLSVTVLEKHADFLRDFRGDTIHASTLNLMDELGWGDEFLRLPHQKARTLSGVFGNREYTFGDCGRLPVRHRYIALMPQWDFLDFLAGKAGQLHLASGTQNGFTLLRSTEVDGLLRGPRSSSSGRPSSGRVVGPHLRAARDGGAIPGALFTSLDSQLARVQLRRLFPTIATQLLQRALGKGVIERVLSSDQPLPVPRFVKLASRFPILQGLPARAVAIGFLPEHIGRG